MKRTFITSVTVATLATFMVGFVNVGPKVIYGEDNRRDVYEVPEAQIREVSESTVALVYFDNIMRTEDGWIQLKTRRLGDRMNLCSQEPYIDQPSVAHCSGALVGPDLVATAGHCIDAFSCGGFRFVFGFRMLNKSSFQVNFSEDDVYTCKEVVDRQYGGGIDYALVRLDRNVLGRKPLPLQIAAVKKGDPLYVIGHPSGLPTKVADDALVRSQNNIFFNANLDTYGGNSGSAVFNASTHEIVGILVRGAVDFVYDSVNRCSKSNVCSFEGCRGEDVTNISFILEALRNLR